MLENYRYGRETTVLAGHSEIRKCFVRQKTTRKPWICKACVEKWLINDLLENVEMFKGGSFLDRWTKNDSKTIETRGARGNFKTLFSTKHGSKIGNLPGVRGNPKLFLIQETSQKLRR